MVIPKLNSWISNPEQLNQNTLFELRQLVERFPYFEIARILFLKNLCLLKDDSFHEELEKSISFISNRKKLFFFLEANSYIQEIERKAKTYELDEKEAIVKDRTLSLIDDFLSNESSEEIPPKQSEYEYSTDYLAFLDNSEKAKENKEKEETLSQEDVDNQNRSLDLINNFINSSDEEPSEEIKSGNIETKDLPSETTQKAESEADESCFTETLARIYIKQHRYSKAIEIIKKLSLKYPKKNVYFADQITFLEKLIINAKTK